MAGNKKAVKAATKAGVAKETSAQSRKYRTQEGNPTLAKGNAAGAALPGLKDKADKAAAKTPLSKGQKTTVNKRVNQSLESKGLKPTRSTK